MVRWDKQYFHFHNFSCLHYLMYVWCTLFMVAIHVMEVWRSSLAPSSIQFFSLHYGWSLKTRLMKVHVSINSNLNIIARFSVDYQTCLIQVLTVLGTHVWQDHLLQIAWVWQYMHACGALHSSWDLYYGDDNDRLNSDTKCSQGTGDNVDTP